MADLQYDLFEDVYLGRDLEKVFEDLAKKSNEVWSVKDGNDNGILINYLKNTYNKLCEEDKILLEKVKAIEYIIFNTGLFTEHYSPIFACMENNNSEKKYRLTNFCDEYELGKLGISIRPERANYFEDPELLIFDAKCDINVQYDHILNNNENLERFPSSVREQKNLRNIFVGAIDAMKKKVMANYKIAVPQYYNSMIQLLLPLCLEDPDKTDLALVVTKCPEGNFYQGHTCLTLDMAYNNARLIAKPESSWLQP